MYEYLQSDRYERDRWSVLSYILLFSISLIWETIIFKVPHCHLQVHYWTNCEDWKMKWTQRENTNDSFLKITGAFQKRAVRLSRIFPQGGFFAGFSLYTCNFAGRISKAAIGGAGARSALFCVFTSLKRQEPASHGSARAAKNPIVPNILFPYLTHV